MIRSIGLAVLINFGVIAVASARQPVGDPQDFSAVGSGRTVAVITESGLRTEGRLLRFTPDALVLAVRTGEAVFERRDVSSVYERGDSLRNGMKKGAIAGGGFGAFIGVLIAGVAGEEQVAAVVIPTALFGLMGMGLGAAVDGAIVGKRQLYEQTPGARIEGGADDFSGLAAGRAITVVEESGLRHTGFVRRATPDTLTVTVGDRTRTFTRAQVSTIFERGDSVKNGMMWGLLAGAATGFTAGVSKTTCGRDPVGIGYISAYLSYSPCTAGERIGQGLGEGALLGLLGTGIGAAIDALIPGRRLVYEKAEPAGAAFSIVPSLAPSRISLMTSVSW